MKSQFETAARDVHDTVNRGIDETRTDIERSVAGHPGETPALTTETAWTGHPVPAYKPPRKNWRLKRGALPDWYKRREGVRTHAQSGAARVARFRPTRARPL
jgi:sec-independent protein translocase protein TatB